MKIVPFLVESKDSGFVIFRVELKDKPDIYIWVDDDYEPGSEKGIRVTSFYGVASYFTHTVEPLIAAGHADEDFLRRAVERLDKCPKEPMRKMLSRVVEDIESKMTKKEEWDEYLEWEREAIEAVEKANEEGDGLVMF